MTRPGQVRVPITFNKDKQDLNHSYSPNESSANALKILLANMQKQNKLGQRNQNEMKFFI